MQGRLQFDCRFLVTGLGAHRTRKSLENTFESESPSLLIFTGTSGQLDPSLGLGQVVFPQKLVFKGWLLFPSRCGVDVHVARGG